MFQKFGQQMLHAQCAQTLRISGAQNQPTLGQMRNPFRSMTRRGFSKRKPLRISGAQNQPTLGQMRKPFRSMTRRGLSKRKPLRISGAQNSPRWARRATKDGQRCSRPRRIGSQRAPLYNTTACAGDFSAHPLHCSASPGPASGVVEESTGRRGGLGNISHSDKTTTPENQ